jgi:signal peptidase
MNVAKRLLRRVVELFAWGAGIACVGVLVLVGIGPHTGKYRTLTVLTGSMQPTMPVGSVVVVSPERPSAVRVGQIVTYRIPVEDHRVISHRVIEVVQGGNRPIFRTQGDANNAPDYWLAQVDGDTVWHVTRVLPGLGRAVHWLRLPSVHTAAVLLAPIALALLLLMDIWKESPATTAEAAG